MSDEPFYWIYEDEIHFRYSTGGFVRWSRDDDAPIAMYGDIPDSALNRIQRGAA